MIITAAILLILAAYNIARWTVTRMRKGKYVDHGDRRVRVKEWLIKAATAIPSGVLFSLHQPWLKVLDVPFMLACWYMLFFDSLMGLILGKGIFYNGTDWAGRAKTSKISFGVKVAACTLFTFLYIIL